MPVNGYRVACFARNASQFRADNKSSRDILETHRQDYIRASIRFIRVSPE
jgi:hypothetical protein